ncbi:uncharacterized protein BDR25DRAFT_363076 [Lindgomyces ingoldianus]|uniref:Uncharacterized protein n=1 Tax=Lindgomyces ingoldianus TaxID=673940 RepID=A0ACB6Q8G9_9PLEO|nr:uncharacterized protein BDR25DRAFT_363076 [Lindgomyces ingoldianus]KAF2463170.1 hypothetical protein BDR25DRAFT_363076 [Lindgomyces ingoldianus]
MPTYLVCLIADLGSSWNHHCTFVSIHSDDSDYIFQISGHIQSGMAFGYKAASVSEAWPSFISKEYYSTVSVANYSQTQEVVETYNRQRSNLTVRGGCSLRRGLGGVKNQRRRLLSLRGFRFDMRTSIKPFSKDGGIPSKPILVAAITYSIFSTHEKTRRSTSQRQQDKIFRQPNGCYLNSRTYLVLFTNPLDYPSHVTVRRFQASLIPPLHLRPLHEDAPTP